MISDVIESKSCLSSFGGFGSLEVCDNKSVKFKKDYYKAYQKSLLNLRSTSVLAATKIVNKNLKIESYPIR